MSQKEPINAVIISFQACRIGHGPLHSQRLLKALHELGECDVTFLTGRGFKERVKEWPLYGDIVESDVELETLTSYKNTLEAIHWGIRRRYMQNRLFDELDQILKKKKVDLVFILDGADLEVLYRNWKRYKRLYPEVAWVITHNAIDFWYSNLSIRSMYKGFVARIVKQMTEEMSATILYVDQQLFGEYCNRMRISQNARSRIVLAHFGSDPYDLRLPRNEARERLGIPADAKVALFFGLLRRDKRPDIAVQAVSRAPKEWWILLAGKPYSYSDDEIMSWINQEALVKRCIPILRYLDDNEVRYVFSSADALLLPYERDTLSNSGPFSMSLSYRIPIIVSDIGSLGRLVKSKGIGFVAEPGNPDNFAEQLTKLGRLSPNDLIDMQYRLSQTGQEFSFESTAQTYLHAFKLAIAGRKTDVRRK